jgi:hypothetical protein
MINVLTAWRYVFFEQQDWKDKDLRIGFDHSKLLPLLRSLDEIGLSERLLNINYFANHPTRAAKVPG